MAPASHCAWNPGRCIKCLLSHWPVTSCHLYTTALCLPSSPVLSQVWHLTLRLSSLPGVPSVRTRTATQPLSLYFARGTRLSLHHLTNREVWAERISFSPVSPPLLNEVETSPSTSAFSWKCQHRAFSLLSTLLMGHRILQRVKPHGEDQVRKVFVSELNPGEDASGFHEQMYTEGSWPGASPSRCEYSFPFCMWKPLGKLLRTRSSRVNKLSVLFGQGGDEQERTSGKTLLLTGCLLFPRTRNFSVS